VFISTCVSGQWKERRPSIDGHNMKRQDTQLEAQGAEFLVLGHLLIAGIHAYKSYVNFPGYDLTAVNAKSRKTARLQVKSRWASDYDKGFPMKSFDCDFVIHVALNRGYAFRKKTTHTDPGVKAPEFFILPVAVVRSAHDDRQSWGKVHLARIADLDNYRNNWRLIRDFIE
jgi:hypothetical protein